MATACSRGTAETQSKSAYRPEIDGLRALSVLAVLVNHLDSTWLPGGFLGVDIFFVISGYVVTSSLLVHQESSWLNFLVLFYRRRFRRLLPALIVNVTVVAIVFALIVPPMEDLHASTIRTGVSALFGVSNLYLLRQGANYFAADNHFNVFLHTWSLGIEEQFYLIWPGLLLLCGFGVAKTSRQSLRLLKSVCLILIVSSLAFFIVLQWKGQADRAFFLTSARFWELASGSLAYLFHRGSGTARDLGHRLTIEHVRSPLSIGLLLALIGTLFMPEDLRAASTIAITTLAAALMVLVQRHSAVGRFLCHPMMVAVGLLSYSLYLWHWPVIVLFRWTVGVGPRTIPMILLLIGLLTLLSYRLEAYFRFGKGRQVPLFSYSLAAAAATATLLLLQGPLRTLAFLGDRSSLEEASFNMKRIPGTTINSKNCFDEPTAPLRRQGEEGLCHAVRNPSLPTLYFEGDSHTHALIPLAEKILAGGKWNVAIHSRGGCPSPYFEPRNRGQHAAQRYRLCRPDFEKEIQLIDRLLKPGDQVVLVSNLTGYILGLQPTQLQAATDSYNTGLERFAAVAEHRGAGVILFGPLPSFPQQNITLPLSMCRPEWFRPSSAIDKGCRAVHRSRTELLNANEPVRAILAALPKRFAQVSLFEPFESICPAAQRTCSTHRGSALIFSDGNHLTNFGASELFVRFDTFLNQLPLSPPISK